MNTKKLRDLIDPKEALTQIIVVVQLCLWAAGTLWWLLGYYYMFIGFGIVATGLGVVAPWVLGVIALAMIDGVDDIVNPIKATAASIVLSAIMWALAGLIYFIL